MESKFNPFEKLNNEWALVTAGDKKKFNSMTISWGGFGVLWFKNVITIYLRPQRYTLEFLNKNDIFTVSFFDEKYKKDLGVLGSKSGRDCDKLSLTNLTPKFLKQGITYNEASKTYVLKKIYQNQFNEKNIPNEIKNKFYNGEQPHIMIIGEILEVI
ncbi:MAG: hypothetical protein IJ837_03770 [Clostridia bacterium]|nr:hypothetical protein [Clostridia bacterium]